MVTKESSKSAGQWETVKGRKGDKKKKLDEVSDLKPKVTKQSASAPSAPAPSALTASNTFDALFEKEQNVSPGDTDQKRGKLVGGDILTPGTPPQSQEQNLPPFSLEDGQKDQVKDKKPKKVKKKSGKKPEKAGKSGKSNVPVPSGISTADLRAVLKDVEKRYPNNEAAQLEYIADAFLGFYKEASIGFPSDVRKKPHQQTLDLADGFLTDTAAKELKDFLKEKSAAGLSEGLAVLLRALFDASDDVNASKGQVGLVLLVSVTARSNPVAVVQCMEELVYEGARFTSADRLPLLLWVFSQAERGAHGAFLACWMRILLPQLIGSPTQNPATVKGRGKGKKKQGAVYSLDSKASQRAVVALDRALNGGANTFGVSAAIKTAGKAGLKCTASGSEAREPIVTLLALDQILCLLHSPGSTPERILKALEDLYPSFRIFAFSSANSTSLHSFVPLALGYAGKSDGGYMGPGDRIVAEAARNLIACLEKDIECFEVWTVNHKKQIKGSCRILQHLLHRPPREFIELMKRPAPKEAFLGTMKKLQERHGFLLAQDKGWQAACAKGAHEASKKFLDGTVKSVKSSMRFSTRALFMLCISTGVVSAMVVSKWDDIEYTILSLKNTEAWEKVEKFLQSDSMTGVVSTAEMAKSYAMEVFEDFKEKATTFFN